MNIELHQILGTWRHTNGNILIDFNIRHVNHGENVARAMFTIYQREPESKIHYEWHGAVEIVNHENDISEIVISEIVKTEEKPEYENLKIWSIEPGEMYLELGNGDRILFRKLGNIFS
ncbi:hypothetical protein EOD40_11205 [Flavobacterium sufflavum]|uniref:DUF1579 domain-containing protein n=1 Tax=Flavobacterium sufflavum TaxID=1921138 RepID=A0A3S2U1Q3_9FLAO|nr:hypothetical protein [Flavobacterium sufflavum]RVT75325.1 hypothetical protein EOD40_11205 [Flavobacterium sufflavum]